MSDLLFGGGGEAGALMRSIDWASTPLGPVEGWSPALSSTVALLLHNQSSMLLWWGPRYVQIYNDAYRPVLGDKHPRAMGQPTRECWSEIWHIIGPRIDQPFHGGPASTSDDLAVLINRKGFVEETHFRLAYSQVPDPSVEPTRVGGVLATVTETTEQVYGERQWRTLRELGSHVVTANTAELACASAAATLNLDPWDVPFALFYLLDRDGEHARLVASAGFDADLTNQDTDLWALSWPLSEVTRERRASIVHDLGPLEAALPRSPSGERPRSVIVLPLASPDHPHAYGVLVCGVSPHRTLDDGYQTFFELVALQVVTTIRNARAFEAQRRRAEELEEIEGNRAKDEFLAMLGHELRNPLTPILATLRLMRMDGGKKFAKERCMIERQALHLARLVDDLLDVSRITRGKLELQRAQVDLGAIVTRAIEVATPLLEERGHFLRIDVEPGALVDADENRLVQVVSNLLINSAKYTPPGGRIEISVRSQAEAVVLRVRDDGMGIASELLPHVFDLFRQGRQGSERPLGGLGLGLAIVRSIVELHGGEVSAASDGPGKGSELAVRLPRIPEKRTAKKRALRASASSASDNPIRILVVDDNRDIVEVLVNLLRQRGHNVAVAYDGASALAAIKARPPQVALLDIGLPEIDGYELARRIRAQNETRDVELIAMTGYGQPGDRARATEAGFTNHVTKPFDFEELMKIVERRTDGAPARSARRNPGRRPRRAPSVATSTRDA